MSDSSYSSSSSSSNAALIIICIIQGIILAGLFTHQLLQVCSRHHLYRGKAQPYVFASSSIQELLLGGNFSFFNTLCFSRPETIALYSTSNIHHLRRIKHQATEDINFDFDVIVPQVGSHPVSSLVSGRVISFPITLLSVLVEKVNQEVLLPKYALKTTKQRRFGDVTSPFSPSVLALTTLFALFPLALLITNGSMGNALLPTPLLTGLAFITLSGLVGWLYLAVNYVSERREISEYIVSLIPELSRFLSQSRDVHFLLTSRSVDVTIRVTKGLMWTNVDLVATVANTLAQGRIHASPPPYLHIRGVSSDEPQGVGGQVIEEDDPAAVDVSRSNSVNPRAFAQATTSTSSGSPIRSGNSINNL